MPFGDYFPLRPVLGWIMNLLHIPMSDFSHGERVQQPIQAAGQKIAVNICYEDAFGEEIIRQLPEATVLANFTNDAWWGESVASRAASADLPDARHRNRPAHAARDQYRGHRDHRPEGTDIAASAPEFTTAKVTGEIHGYQGATPLRSFGNAGL